MPSTFPVPTFCIANAMPEQEEQETPEPRRRWGRWLFWGILIVAAAPSLLTFSGKHSIVLNWISADFARSVRYQSASLHWWSPVEFRQVEIKDCSVSASEQDAPLPLATIESIRTVQPLWKMALSGGNGVEVNIAQPELNLVLSEGQTNLEETLRKILPQSDSGGASVRYKVNVTDGSIHVAEGAGSRTDSAPLVRDINATISTRHNGAWPAITMTASLHRESSGDFLADSNDSTRVAANLNEVRADFPVQPLQPLHTQTSSGQPTFELTIDAPDENDAQRLSLSMRRVATQQIQPLIHRVFPEVACAGDVSLRVQTRIINGDVSGGLAGRLQLLGENIRWRDRSWIAGESLRLDRISAEGVVAIADDGFLLEGVRVRSDVINADGDGEVRYIAPDPAAAIERNADNLPGDLASAAEAASHGTVRLNGKLNLAAVSWMLPETLGIRPGMKLSRADIEFGLRVLSMPRVESAGLDLGLAPENFQWQLDVQSSPLVGNLDGRVVEVDSELKLNARGRLSRQHASLDSMDLSGHPGKIRVSPIEHGYRVVGRLEPELLWKELQAFLDLPKPGLRGDLEIAGDIFAADEALQFREWQIVSDDLEITTDQIDVDMNRPLSEMVDGSVDIRGFSAALKTVIAPWHDATWLSDAATVAARFTAERGRKIHAIAVIKPYGGSASESDSAFVRSGRFEGSLLADSQTGILHVEAGTLEFPGLRANINGTIGVREGQPHLHLTADAQYDLTSLSRQFLSDDGSLMLLGRGEQRYEITGSPTLLTPHDLRLHRRLQSTSVDHPAEALAIQGGLSWDSGRVYGAQLGPGQIRLQLEDGVLGSTPVQTTLSGGQVNVLPRWRLQENVIELASGARVSGLPLTQDLAQTWLGYVSPMLAESASVDGTVSVRLQQFAWFVDQPEASVLDGVLGIEQASAAAGSSLAPVIQVLELLSRKSLSDRKLQFPTQDVRVQLNSGVVQHDRLDMDLNGYLITTSGRVSLQEQVDLTLFVPTEKGDTERRLQIPVRGTVQRPVPAVDGLLQNLGRQQIESRVNGELNRQIDNGLNRLLDKLR